MNNPTFTKPIIMETYFGELPTSVVNFLEKIDSDLTPANPCKFTGHLFIVENLQEIFSNADCHFDKDDFTQNEYQELYSFFNSIKESEYLMVK